MTMVYDRLECRAQDAAELLRAMSNAHRLAILCHLAKGERSVGWLAGATGIGQSAVSQHLSILRAQGLVKNRRAAQTVYYSVDGVEAQAILEALYRVFCGDACGGEVAEAA